MNQLKKFLSQPGVKKMIGLSKPLKKGVPKAHASPPVPNSKDWAAKVKATYWGKSYKGLSKYDLYGSVVGLKFQPLQGNPGLARDQYNRTWKFDNKTGGPPLLEDF